MELQKRDWEPEADEALGFNILTPSLTRLEISPRTPIGNVNSRTFEDRREPEGRKGAASREEQWPYGAVAPVNATEHLSEIISET
ncbi:hypothetical protein HZH66_014244 [Vespula vulgaris]|uniref:Uncharacterized protein n=1 Tax=Vespula vulgaris TaxID=7454 RepID=A0A834MS27_VESVU|nr:hypothetical protein HZH66_014244 [Vespula vulgaris]